MHHKYLFPKLCFPIHQTDLGLMLKNVFVINLSSSCKMSNGDILGSSLI